MDTSSLPPETVILWVHPRSTSTMFECALLQRDDFRVLHEPMGDAWYFGPERQSKRYSPKQCAEEFPHFKDSTFQKCWKGIVASPSRTDGGPRRTFSKDMAQYLFPSSPLSSADGNPTLIPTSQLLSPSIRHTFLIRTPSKAIPSYHRLCHPGSATGFEYFDPSEAGYRELRLLFDFMRTQGVDPLVIESDDLLKEPTKVMRGWCESVGIQFDEGMLEWNEGTREHFAKWPGFHTAAEGSSGIGKCNDSSSSDTTPAIPVVKVPAEEMPKIVCDCIADSMPDYLHLSQFVSSFN